MEREKVLKRRKEEKDNWNRESAEEEVKEGDRADKT